MTKDIVRAASVCLFVGAIIWPVAVPLALIAYKMGRTALAARAVEAAVIAGALMSIGALVLLALIPSVSR
jgi:hypothetical protein